MSIMPLMTVGFVSHRELGLLVVAVKSQSKMYRIIIIFSYLEMNIQTINYAK